MDQKVGRIREKLKTRHYTVNHNWLSDCISYFLAENKPDATDEETLAFVVTQLELSNFREICSETGCLPKNLGQQKCTTLPGKYILQVEMAYDISLPKYKQLERIRDVSTVNIEVTEADISQPWEPKSNRMMQLFLTDGTQDVSAIEYKSIRTLKDAILPGFKVMIIGPVICRRGVILLEEKNFKLLGGEVDSLLISNAQENIFARALGLPENPDPYNDLTEENGKDLDTQINQIFDDDDFDIDMDTIAQLEETRFPQDRAQNVLSTNQPKIVPKTSSNQVRNMMTAVDKRKSEDFQTLPVCFEENFEQEPMEFPDEDDEIFAMVDESHFENVENEQIKSNSRPANSVRIEDEEIILSDDEFLSVEAPPVKKPIVHQTVEKKVVQNVKNNFDEFPTDLELDDFEDDLLTQRAIEESLGKCSKKETTTKNCQSFETFTNFVGKRLLSESRNKEPEKAQNKNQIWNKPTTSEQSVISTAKPSTCEKTFVDKKIRAESSISSPTSTFKMPAQKDSPKSIGANKKITDFMTKSNQPQKICDFICELKGLSIDGVIKKKFRAKTKKLSRLEKKNSQWHVEFTIKDGTGHLDVVIAPEILEKFIGYTVEEFFQIKKLKKMNPEVDKQLREALRNAESKIKDMNGLLEIEFRPNTMPKILKIKELNDFEHSRIDENMRQLGNS